MCDICRNKCNVIWLQIFLLFFEPSPQLCLNSEKERTTVVFLFTNSYQLTQQHALVKSCHRFSCWNAFMFRFECFIYLFCFSSAVQTTIPFSLMQSYKFIFVELNIASLLFYRCFIYSSNLFCSAFIIWKQMH